jgi:hypothetical protein
MYKVTTTSGTGSIVESNDTNADWIVQFNGDDPQPVYGSTPLQAFKEAGYDVLSVVALSYE